MLKSRRFGTFFMSMVLAVAVISQNGVVAQASGTGNYLDGFNGGVASILRSTTMTKTGRASLENQQAYNSDKEQSQIVMANVQSVLNVRSDVGEDAPKIGRLYKDCGGTILERKDGWTKLRSGNLVGWASDQYLLFDEEAEALAGDVGKRVATIAAESLRVRKEPNAGAEIYGLLPKGEIVEVLDDGRGEWVCIDYEGKDGYVAAEFIVQDFKIDAGETLEEVKAREEAEREAKRHVNYGQYTTDADTTLLLAALIQCEAGGESYEGQVAVGAVVLNRVRSGAYPDSIHGVIYASGQFTPAMNGKVNAVYSSGRIYESCIRAAQEALAGTSNVGDCTHFRRNNGRDGIVIGNHVFY